ncbi:MAG: hypothetical protein GYA57_19220 [Myxococcales bacterium]|nr:hypothetical protein [Myxococcales bacterium]
MRRSDGWLVLAFLAMVTATAAAQPAEEPAAGTVGEPAAGEPAAGEAATSETAVDASVNPFATVVSDAAAPSPVEPEVLEQTNPYARSGEGRRVVEEGSRPAASGEDEGAPVPSAPPGGEEESGSAPAGSAPAPAEPAATLDEGEWLERLAEVSEEAPLVQIAAGPLVLAPVGMFQLLGVPWQGEDARRSAGDLVDEAGFRFGRARIGLMGWGPWDFRFESSAEFTEDGAELLDLSLTWAPFEALAISAGSGKAPFSGAMLTPAMFLTFLDRPWGVDGETGDGWRAGIAPGRMLGAWISGRWNVLRWQAGVYNGNADYFVGNDNDGMLYGGRIEVHPLGDLPEGQLMAADGAPLLRVGAAYYFNDDAAGNTHGAEGDVKFRWLGLTVEGEFLWSTFALAADPSRPPDTAGDIDRMAYYVQAGYLLYGDWVELAARFDSFELNDGIDDFNDRWSVGAVATLFLLRNRIKLQLEYMHHQEWADPQVSNDHVALQLQGRF